MTKIQILTKEGKEKLERQLASLRKERRVLVVKLDETRRMGDLVENFAYQELRNQLSILDSRIEELEEVLAGAKVVVDNSGADGKVWFGSSVKIRQGNKERIIQLVGAGEANPLKGKISYDSPLGRALLNKTAGEKVAVETPSGKVEYELVEVLN